jgi:LPS sulfotransferase NodH
MGLIESLKQKEMDFPRREADPVLQYMLATSPRSGSTYVGLLLWRSGIMGAPLEYLNLKHMQDMIARLGQGDPTAYWRELRRVRTSPNGVFGFKMFLGHYRQLSEGQPGLLLQIRADRVIFLSRRDKITQAISNYRAAESGAWFADSRPRRELEYDFAKIASYLEYVNRQEEIWEYIFRKQGTEALRIFYEDVASNPEDACGRIRDFLCPQPAPASAPVDLELTSPQSDETSLLWRKRFVDDLAQQARAGMTGPGASASGEGPRSRRRSEEQGDLRDPLTLLLYGVPGCEPCAVVKAALENMAWGELQIRFCDLDDIRAFRKQVGQRLIYPTLVLRDGNREVGRREGARSGDPEEERRQIVEWVEGVLASGPQAGEGPVQDGRPAARADPLHAGR